MAAEGGGLGLRARLRGRGAEVTEDSDGLGDGRGLLQPFFSHETSLSLSGVESARKRALLRSV